jgi:hypothetical protein
MLVPEEVPLPLVPPLIAPALAMTVPLVAIVPPLPLEEPVPASGGVVNVQ